HREEEPRARLRGRRILIVAETYDHLRLDVVPKLEPLIPEWMLAEAPRTEERCKVEFKSIWGSVLKLMTYKQSRKIFEGWQTDRAFLNEPPPQDIFNAIVRGQVKRKSRVCFVFTPVPPEDGGNPNPAINWLPEQLTEPAQRPGTPS